MHLTDRYSNLRGMRSGDNTRQNLLTTALQLVWEKSYGVVSVDDICREAHANKGSFYHFFPSKTDLAVAAIEDHWQELQPLLDHVFSAQFEPLERLRGFCRFIYKRQSEKALSTGKVCGCPFISMASEVSTQQERIRLKLRQIMNRYERYFASALRDAASEGSLEPQDFSAKACELYGYVIGVLVQARIQNDLEIIRSMEAGLWRLLGIQPHERRRKQCRLRAVNN